tara:strand:+ start:107 stop:883 length:777 start_codon:yes stop_codon:yes gene_type:complete
MTTIANSVFYCFHKNNNVNDVIQSLHPYFFVKDEVLPLPVQDVIAEKNNHADSNTKTYDHTDFFIPTQKDSLFWCLYVAMYSHGEYQAIHRNYGLKKMEINQFIFDYLKDNIHLLKQANHKFTKAAVTELLADLSINQQSTSLVNVYAYLSFYKFNVYIINKDKHSYLPFIIDNELPIYFIYVDGFKQYKLQTVPVSSCDIKILENNFVSLEGIRKSLKGVSAYKIADLTCIMNILNLPIDNLKKNDMYETILETIHW